MSSTVTLVKLDALAQIQTDTVAANVAAVTPLKNAAESARDTAITQAGIATTQASNAGGSAAAALNSQNAAAASAATALNAQATEYLGAIAGTAVPATATTKGQYYLITTAGTSPNVPAINWTVGDKAVYNGTSGSWSRITGFNAASNTYAEGVGATRVGSGYLYSDGITTNRAQVQVPGSRSNLAGALQASWVGWVEVPSTTIGADCQIFSLTSAVISNPWSSSSLYANIAPAGHLQITQLVGSLSTYRTFSLTNFRSNYSGQRIWLDVRFTFGTSDPVVFFNGVNVSSSFSLSFSGTANWLDSTTPSVYTLTGVNWPAGTAPLGCWLNAHLTNTESEAWRITGRPPVWVAQGGSRDVIYTSNFSAGLDGWSEIANGQSVLTGNVDAVSGVNDTLRISPGTSGVIQIQNVAVGLVANTRQFGYEVVFDYYLDTASGVTSLYLGGVNSPNSNQITPVEGSWQVGVRLTTNLYTESRYIACSGGLAAGKNLYIKNMVVRRTGALSLPQVQPGTANVLDATTIGGNDASLTGMIGVTGTDAQFTDSAIDLKALTKSSAGYLWSDGTVTNRAQIQIPGPRGNLAGAAQASWVGWVDVPFSNSDTQIFSITSSTAAALSNSLQGYILSSGSLFIEQVGALSTDYRRWSLSTFRSSYQGTRVWLEVRFTNGSTAPVVRINGGNDQIPTSTTTNGTIPNWLDSNLATTFSLTGFRWPTGIAPLGCWLNAHLTNAESEAWRITGRPPVWVSAGGYASDVKPVSSSFAYWFGTGSVVSSTATQLVAAAGANQLNVRNPVLTINPPIGAKVLVNVTVSGLTGTATIQLSTLSISAVSPTISADGTYTLEINTSVGNQQNVVIAVTSSTQTTVTINSVQLRGALSLPAVQSINVLDDITGIGGNQARVLGMAPVLTGSMPTSSIEVAPRLYTANTWVEILGGAITGSKKRKIVSVTGNSSTSCNMHMGTVTSTSNIFGSPTVSVNGDYDVSNSSFSSRIVWGNSSLFVMFSADTTASIHIHLTDL